MFDGRAVRYQRRTGTPRDVRVKRAAVSISGGIQPDILRKALSDPAYIASGLAARLLFAMPPKQCPRWSDAEPDQLANLRFGEIVAALRTIPYNPKSNSLTVGLESEAHHRFVMFSDQFSSRAECLDGGPMESALPKLIRYALRLALIHHAVSLAAADVQPWKSGVTEESMIAGIALAEWFANEAERVYAMLGERPEESAVRRLAELVCRKGGSITPRELLRSRGDLYPRRRPLNSPSRGLCPPGGGNGETGNRKPAVIPSNCSPFIRHPTLDSKTNSVSRTNPTVVFQCIKNPDNSAQFGECRVSDSRRHTDPSNVGRICTALFEVYISPAFGLVFGVGRS